MVLFSFTENNRPLIRVQSESQFHMSQGIIAHDTRIRRPNFFYIRVQSLTGKQGRNKYLPCYFIYIEKLS
ncbi:hypothetical protein AB432_009025 [Brevibacillus brevis]|uniref:Uncharacterized protein n=1 Tax=Brevibacillus brevis TaxID=1393 RepID=A0A2Z4MFF8_BREBE|nr:hypothetical protein AB432_009025 [Brevibacillus brevis]